MIKIFQTMLDKMYRIYICAFSSETMFNPIQYTQRDLYINWTI